MDIGSKPKIVGIESPPSRCIGKKSLETVLSRFGSKIDVRNGGKPKRHGVKAQSWQNMAYTVQWFGTHYHFLKLSQSLPKTQQNLLLLGFWVRFLSMLCPAPQTPFFILTKNQKEKLPLIGFGLFASALKKTKPKTKTLKTKKFQLKEKLNSKLKQTFG